MRTENRYLVCRIEDLEPPRPLHMVGGGRAADTVTAWLRKNGLFVSSFVEPGTGASHLQPSVSIDQIEAYAQPDDTILLCDAHFPRYRTKLEKKGFTDIRLGLFLGQILANNNAGKPDLGDVSFDFWVQYLDWCRSIWRHGGKTLFEQEILFATGVSAGHFAKTFSSFENAQEFYSHYFDNTPYGRRRQHFVPLSKIFLAMGFLEDGWLFYECEKRVSGKSQGIFHQPVWNGESLEGKSATIWRGHGPGDEIMYASMHADIISKADSVVIETDPRLVDLFQRSFKDAQVVARQRPPSETAANTDLQIHLAAPGRYMRKSPSEFPRQPFLVPDPVRASYWQERISKLTGGAPVIGINWRSYDRVANAPYNTAVEDWAGILSVSGAKFINLQYDDCNEELDLVRSKFGIHIEQLNDIDLFNGLDEVAAALSAFDLVISINTVIANIAGGVGTPVWQIGPDWCHTNLGQTGHSLWYPNHRLFLFSSDYPKARVLQDIVEALPSFLKDHPSARNVIR